MADHDYSAPYGCCPGCDAPLPNPWTKQCRHRRACEARQMILERYAALLDRVTVLERALDKIGILVADEQAQADPRGALRVVSSMVDRALDG
jgi:hypothetical protein